MSVKKEGCRHSRLQNKIVFQNKQQIPRNADSLYGLWGMSDIKIPAACFVNRISFCATKIRQLPDFTNILADFYREIGEIPSEEHCVTLLLVAALGGVSRDGAYLGVGNLSVLAAPYLT